MAYTLIRADEIFSTGLPKPRVFLGGTSKGRDWRSMVLQRFESDDITFISPKRDPFVDPELDPVAHARQVEWERRALDECDIAVFWLGEGLNNQAARVEMGYALGAGKPTLIGADENFLGAEHLTAFGGLVVSSSIEGLIERFASLMAKYE